MQKKSNNIIINYNNVKEEKYLDNLLLILDNKYNELKSFFNNIDLSSEIVFNIWDNLEEFKNMCTTRYGYYREGTVGKANGNNIDILSYDERIKVEKRKNDSIEYYFMSFCHEMVHRFHIEYKGNSKGTWFAEGLACTLGSPRYEMVEIDCDIDDLINRKVSYKYYYSLVRYMLDNYSHDKILEYAKNDELLNNDTYDIVNDYNSYYRNVKKRW